MTVRELREMLFSVTDQDAEVEFITKTRFGRIETTQPISGIHARSFDHDGVDLKADLRIPAGFVLLS